MHTANRVVVLMIDGFGQDYFDRSPMPHLSEMARAGLYKPGRAVFPSLTNANNISIACGCWPDEHGVTTNSYFDESTGRAEFLEDASFLCAPTIFDRARTRGIRSALLTCKAKTALILGRGLEVAIAAEAPAGDVVDRFGPPPGMYSAEVNFWLFSVAQHLLTERPEIGLLYVTPPTTRCTCGRRKPSSRSTTCHGTHGVRHLPDRRRGRLRPARNPDRGGARLGGDPSESRGRTAGRRPFRPGASKTAGPGCCGRNR